ncbi:MAG: ABC transporter permease subunit, partial [Halobacteriales archaeon]|nr:ABC transporter permease subunit [Halobacteriales archaeon]
QLLTLVDRELRAVRRNAALIGLLLVLTVVVVGVARLRGAGYAPLALDLVTVLEYLVPVLAFALGYRALLDDDRRGELDMLRTYPIHRSTLVAGVVIGRAVPLLLTIVGALVIAGSIVSLVGGPTSTVLATHGGADAPVLFVRFIVLTTVFALVTLAIGVAVSAIAGSTRQALALAAGLLVALVVGLDLGIIGGLAGGVIPEPMLRWVVAISPNSAYRGLVLETVIAPVTTETVPSASLPASIIGLAGWFIGSLLVARRFVWSR